MKSKLVVLLIASLGLGGVNFSATAQESFYEEAFSLYGYVVNFFNANLYADDWTITDSDYGNILYGRLKGDWNPGDNLSFHAELAYQGSVGNQNPLVVYNNYGLIPPALDLTDPAVTFQEDMIQIVSVDHLWGSVNLGRFDIQFGKLPIAWGTGYFFNPTAKAATIPYLDTVAEETPGTMGIVPSVSFFDGFLSVQGYMAFQDKNHSFSIFAVDGRWNNLPFGLKLQAIAGTFDISTGWVKEVLYIEPPINEIMRIHYLSADFAGAIWNFGVYGEAALKMWDESEEKLAFQYDPILDLLDVCIGFDYFIPGLEIDTRVEYYHQGSGTREQSDYLTTYGKLFTGEQIVLAQDYLLIYLERNFLDYFSIGTVGLVNINDGSFVLVPELSGEPYGNFQVGLGAMLFYGPEGSEFDGEYSGLFDITEPSVYLRCKLSF
jgi:hypothetical protein